MLNILWVDDEPRNLLFEKELIEEICEGYSPSISVDIKFATDIDEAVQALITTRYDLILLDLHLEPPKGVSANVIIQHQTGYSLYRYIVDQGKVLKDMPEFTSDFIFNRLSKPLSDEQKEYLSANSTVNIVVITGNKMEFSKRNTKYRVDDFKLYQDIKSGELKRLKNLEKPIIEDQLNNIIVQFLKEYSANDSCT